jgi:hypothetical protein
MILILASLILVCSILLVGINVWFNWIGLKGMDWIKLKGLMEGSDSSAFMHIWS